MNQPLGIYLIHNGNLTNTDELRAKELNNRHLRTGSDSEVLLNVFAEDLSKEIAAHPDKDSDKQLFDAVTVTMGKVKGAYSIISLINGQGMFAFRDPNGIRPLVLGQRQNADGEGRVVRRERRRRVRTARIHHRARCQSRGGDPDHGRGQDDFSSVHEGFHLAVHLRVHLLGAPGFSNQRHLRVRVPT